MKIKIKCPFKIDYHHTPLYEKTSMFFIIYKQVSFPFLKMIFRCKVSEMYPVKMTIHAPLNVCETVAVMTTVSLTWMSSFLSLVMTDCHEITFAQLSV